VARDAEDGSYWAIQCKCWAEGSELTFKDLGTYLASTSETGYW